MNTTRSHLRELMKSTARRWLAYVLLWFSCALGVINLNAGEADDVVPVLPVPVPMILLDNDLFVGDLVESQSVPTERIIFPPPHTPAKPGAFILRWHNYRTLVVIDDSAGLVKSCWVVTLTTIPEQVETRSGAIVSLARGQVAVAYRAQAYYDKTGILQIDARKAKLSGVLMEDWSPDSFSIGPDKQVYAHDDNANNLPNSGEIEKEVSADQQAAEYRKLSFAAQAIINNNI
jgi:hypothetical protein